MKKLEKTLKALANASRLKMLAYLKRNANSSVEAVSEATKCSYKATSKHLGILFQADIVEREQRGYEMQYRIALVKDAATGKLLDLI